MTDDEKDTLEFALDEEEYDPEDDDSEVGPKIDEDAGSILDRLAEEYEVGQRRTKNNAIMNATIRRLSGRDGGS